MMVSAARICAVAPRNQGAHQALTRCVRMQTRGCERTFGAAGSIASDRGARGEPRMRGNSGVTGRARLARRIDQPVAQARLAGHFDGQGQPCRDYLRKE